MAELAAQHEPDNQANGWDEYLAWEESERQLNELQEKQNVDLRETATSPH